VDLSEVLVDAPEVGGALAVVVHDVAAELPDGPLELVAVELELREPPADAVERVQQRVGLLPHALLDGRHDGVPGVEAAVLLLLQQRLPRYSENRGQADASFGSVTFLYIPAVVVDCPFALLAPASFVDVVDAVVVVVAAAVAA